VDGAVCLGGGEPPLRFPEGSTLLTSTQQFFTMKEISLTQGKVALVDDEDYERVMTKKWSASKRPRTWYAVTGRPGRSMHRFIMNALKGRAA
jgi:hypothetical protein